MYTGEWKTVWRNYMLLLSVIGGILFFLLYCCLVVGKRSDRKLADYEEREEQKTSKDTAKKLGADIWEKQE
ncbi:MULTISPECIES: hypothetical protein [Clostridia]|jgi:hypothetical protein|uniref:Uncharacterized protein n=2 Tax=Lachnospirales TaxID=3085636 RepID=A0ABV1B643_9FIRM|nr:MULTISPECIES: hypothetical protein [Clostridia]